VYLAGGGWFWVHYSPSRAQFWAQFTEPDLPAIAHLLLGYPAKYSMPPPR
jgi:hypothetical protein